MKLSLNQKSHLMFGALAFAVLNGSFYLMISSPEVISENVISNFEERAKECVEIAGKLSGSIAGVPDGIQMRPFKR